MLRGTFIKNVSTKIFDGGITTKWFIEIKTH